MFASQRIIYLNFGHNVHLCHCRRSDDDVFLESWSDYSPEDDYEDTFMESPIDYMEVSANLHSSDNVYHLFSSSGVP